MGVLQSELCLSFQQGLLETSYMEVTMFRSEHSHPATGSPFPYGDDMGVNISSQNSDCKCAKRSLTDLAGESPAVEWEPIQLHSESCVIVGNESDEA